MKNPTGRGPARSLLNALVAVLLASVFGQAGNARADVLLDDATLVSLPSVAPQAQFAFTATATEALTVTLTDFKTPAQFSALHVLVTQGDALVGSAGVDANSKAPLAIAATSGKSYVLHVVGTPDSTQTRGSFNACVTRDADPTPRSCVSGYSFVGDLTTPAASNGNPSFALTTTFTVSAAGTYQIALNDDALPVTLPTLTALLFNGGTPITGPGPVGDFLPGAPASVSLTAGTYTLILGAQADPAALAGLFGVRITDANGSALFDRTFPVGLMAASTPVTLAAASTLSLSLTDLAYPAALTSVGAAVTQGGLGLGTLTASGSLPGIAATTGVVEVWTYATAATSPGVYTLALNAGSTALVSATKVVNPPSNASAGSFAFVTTLPAPGTYTAAVTDFQFPSALQQAPTFTVGQNGAALTVGSSGNFTADAGPIVIVVNAQAPSGGSGLFAVTVQTTATPVQTLLDQTQAVGGEFDTRTVTVGASGNYEVTLTDLGFATAALGFPVRFQTLSIVVSQGSQVLGKIYGGGHFPLPVAPGQYVLSFVTTPGADNYGLYAINIASSAPTVTLSANPTTVSAGQPVQLTWSSTSATSCTAAGATGWNGNEPVTGTLAVTLTAAATLTLTCTGPGGTATATVAVAVTPVASNSRGGGSLDLVALFGLAGLSLLRLGTRSSRSAAV